MAIGAQRRLARLRRGVRSSGSPGLARLQTAGNAASALASRRGAVRDRTARDADGALVSVKLDLH
jgi:hypothetical protein